MLCAVLHAGCAQARGISIKAMPLSLVLEGRTGKSFLVNLIDCPGHVNFNDEVGAAGQYTLWLNPAAVCTWYDFSAHHKHVIDGSATTACVKWLKQFHF